MLDWRFRQYPMPQVENVSRPAPGLRQDGGSAGAQLFPVSKQNYGIKIPLDGAIKIQILPCLIERDSPIDAHNLRSSLFHGGKQRCRICSEINHGNARWLEAQHQLT